MEISRNVQSSCFFKKSYGMTIPKIQTKFFWNVDRRPWIEENEYLSTRKNIEAKWT